MTPRGDDRDRMIDVLLGEVVGGESPPDLCARILAGTGKDRAWAKARLPVAAAAGLFLCIAVLILTHDPTDPVQPAAPVDTLPVLEAPLPEPMQGFLGRFVGKVVALEPAGAVIRVERVVSDKNSRAADPTLFAGRDVRVVFSGRNSERTAGLRETVSRLQREGGLVTATIWTERDEALFLQDVRPGAHVDPDPK